MLGGGDSEIAIRKADLDDVDELVLPARIEGQLEFLLQERAAAKRLRRHRMNPTKGVLLHGPPGTGKSTTGMWLASKLGIDCWLFDIGQAASHYIGQNEKNLAGAFADVAQLKPCVFVLDECDSIFRRRDSDSNATYNSVTNTALQSIDALPFDVLLVATTNMLVGVDPAVIRRFDLLLEIGLPDEECRDRFATNVLSRHGLANHAMADRIRSHLVSGGEGFTLADASRWLRTAIRRSLVLETDMVRELVDAMDRDQLERSRSEVDSLDPDGRRALGRAFGAIVAATESEERQP